MNKTYKKIDLFGNEQTCFVENKTTKPKTLFTDYEGFVDKFEAKKTTDDCYTPKEVFDVILRYVNDKFNLQGFEILRPFMPNGDYKNVDYSENSIVIDNPPFSIISEITRFYVENNIKFFLFAPHLTLFSSPINCTFIVAGADIVYENKATVKTSFVSNLFGDIRILGEPRLLKELEAINDKNKVSLPKYEYPENVVTVSGIQKIVSNGGEIVIKKENSHHCRGLDSQKSHKKAIFGSGYLISDFAAQEKAAQEKAAQEKAAQEKAAQEAKKPFVWELSKKELQIIKQLDK